MRLFIRTLQGRPLLFNVKENDLVWKVLCLVPPGGLPPDYAVTWEGHLLDLNRTLSSYKIREDHVLHAVGAPRLRGTQQRHRRNRQMAEAITLHQEQQERRALQDSEEPAPVTGSTPRSHAATRVAAQAARDAVAMWGPPAPRRLLKKRRVRA